MRANQIQAGQVDFEELCAVISEHSSATVQRLGELRQRVRDASAQVVLGQTQGELLETWTTMVDALIYSLDRAAIAPPHAVAFIAQTGYAREQLTHLPSPPQLLSDIVATLEWQADVQLPRQSGEPPISATVSAAVELAPANVGHSVLPSPEVPARDETDSPAILLSPSAVSGHPGSSDHEAMGWRKRLLIAAVGFLLGMVTAISVMVLLVKMGALRSNTLGDPSSMPAPQASAPPPAPSSK